MADEKNKQQQTGQNANDPNKTKEALNEAQKDIAQDADLSTNDPNDDLDEGETARLGEDKTDLV